ncbi:four helix bundle protein [Carboxylicivirga sp. N1Y90]|uniref:four helix bundle protein n=1 Tax=Carboxylicivirga fragile TaxID=3417571 RepID=UPI003D32DA03|nr:four helix bundle protein [Marinilabiliaceae bacterium N1Y90]
MTGFFDFESLGLYKKAMAFIDLVYEQTKSFPEDEIYGLTGQYRRAANSIALNIGEGYGETIPLALRYLRISKGSIRECVVCNSIALQQNYISSEESYSAREKLLELSKMAVGYKKYLQRL